MLPAFSPNRGVLLLFSFILLLANSSKAQTETFSTGSFIINMGATNPNTVANGLKPYGLIYDLLKTTMCPLNGLLGQVK